MTDLRMEDTLCQVCGQDAALTPLRQCTGCKVTVHAVCYGLNAEHDRDFTCQKCWELETSQVVICGICGGQNGALKRVEEDWAHALCLLFSPRYTLHSVRNVTFTPITKSLRFPQTCALCGLQRGDVYRCRYCVSSAHLHCALFHPRKLWNCSQLLSGQRFLLCPDHIPVTKVTCGCAQPSQHTDILTCPQCHSRFYTCMQGRTPAFLCHNCRLWREMRTRLVREDSGGAKAWGNWREILWETVSLADRMLVARVVERRLPRLMTLASTEELKETESLANLISCSYTPIEGFFRKAEAGHRLETRTLDLLSSCEKTEISLTAIQELEATCHSQGITITQLPALRLAVSQSEAVTRIKTMMQQHALLTQAKEYFSVAVMRLGNDSKWVKYLKIAIDQAENWKNAVEEKLKIQEKWKLDMEEAENLLMDGKKLSLQVADTLELLNRKISESNSWAKILEKTTFPVSQVSIDSLSPLFSLSIWTPKQKEIASMLLLKRTWESEVTECMSGSVVPSMESLGNTVRQGRMLCKYFHVSDEVYALERVYQEGVGWRDKAKEALGSEKTPKEMQRLLEEGLRLKVKPEEMEEVRERARVNEEIAKALQFPCSESHLRHLQSHSRLLHADPQYINSLDVRIDSLDDFLSKFTSIFSTSSQETEETYQILLDEMTVLKLDLTPQKQQLEDAIKSLHWIKIAKNPINSLHFLIQESEKITYKLPKMNLELTRIIDEFWSKEWNLREKTVEELLQFEAFHGQNCPISFTERLKTVKTAINNLEMITENSLFDYQSCRSVLHTNLSILHSEKVVLPVKLQHITQYTDWTNWCFSVENALKSPKKVQIQDLYAYNDQALSLSVPLISPQFQALNAFLTLYEQWLSRFCAFQEAKKPYFGAQIEPFKLLKMRKMHPKTQQKELILLINDGKNMICECKNDLEMLISDLEKATFWTNKMNKILEKCDLKRFLVMGKRNLRNAKQGSEFMRLEEATREYISGIAVEIEEFSANLGSFFWYFHVLEVLEGGSKVKIEEWDEIISEIPLLTHVDSAIIEKISRQDALHRQIQQFSFNSSLTLEELLSISEKFSSCIVISPSESLINSLLEGVSEGLEAFERLWTTGASEEEFTESWNRLLRLNISLPDTEKQVLWVFSKLTDLKEALNSLLSATYKPTKEVIIDIISTAEAIPVRLAGIETLRSSLSSSEVVLMETRRATESTSLEVVLEAERRLEGVGVRIEPEESTLREILWRRKVGLALGSGVKPENGVLEQWREEKWGAGTKEREELERVLRTTQVSVPADTSCSLTSASDYIPPKRHKSAASCPSLTPLRSQTVSTLQSTLTTDFFVPPETAALLSPKLEQCLYKQSLDYTQAVSTFLQSLEVLAYYEEFWEKLLGDGIEWKLILSLNPAELRKGNVLKRLFGRLPRVIIPINTQKLGISTAKPTIKHKNPASNHFLTDLINDFKAFQDLQRDQKREIDPEFEPSKRISDTIPVSTVKKPKIDTILGANAKADQSNEYSILDFVPILSSNPTQGKCYNPEITKNRVLVWSGIVEIMENTVKVEFYTENGVQEGRKMPGNGENIRFARKIKTADMEMDLKSSQNTTSGWIETESSSLIEQIYGDLQRSDCVFQSQHDENLFYLTISSKSVLVRSKLTFHILHNMRDMEEESDLAVLNRVLGKLQDGEVLSEAELRELKAVLMRDPAPEVSQLIESIDGRLSQGKTGEANVTEFLMSQTQSCKAKDVNPRYAYSV